MRPHNPQSDRPLPKHLYKYVGPERLDILQNGRIRFSQPEAFNDPFEFLPVLSQLLQPSGDAFASKLFRTIAGSLNQKIQSAIGMQLGILSLADNSLHPLMWAHYASSHEGFAIELDTSHAFFDQRGGVADSCKHLRPVRYSQLRPSLGEGVELIDMYYTKSECWEYEGEWRLVLPLRECAETKAVSGRDICLFNLPRESITAVVVGCRAAPVLIDGIKEAIRVKPELRLAKLRKVQLDAAEFVLKVQDVPV